MSGLILYGFLFLVIGAMVGFMIGDAFIEFYAKELFQNVIEKKYTDGFKGIWVEPPFTSANDSSWLRKLAYETVRTRVVQRASGYYAQASLFGIPYWVPLWSSPELQPVRRSAERVLEKAKWWLKLDHQKRVIATYEH